ncbi:hypothetical protein B7494_g1088 [Chlorociboria aeruginascens]|nr:hypothetical protein B7494_g1088 [Chlorociboria aeruginascens]
MEDGFDREIVITCASITPAVHSEEVVRYRRLRGEDEGLTLCTSMKLGCDGHNPCKTCSSKTIECKYSRLQSKGHQIQMDNLRKRIPWAYHRHVITNQKLTQNPPIIALKPPVEIPQPSDRGSINFLLNSGSASFMECFHFPPSDEKRNALDHKSHDPNDISLLDLFGNPSENGSAYSDQFENGMIDFSTLEHKDFIKFLSGPFNQQTDEAFHAAAMVVDENYIPGPAVDISLMMPGEWEQHTPASTAAIQAIMERAGILQLNSKVQTELSQHLDYLFMPSRMHRLSQLYFDTWHPHCPIIHRPSFNPDTAVTSLLISMVLMGAMYSSINREASSAKAVADVAEFYAFSIDFLTPEYDIKLNLRGPGVGDLEACSLGPMSLQQLLGAYIMVCVQFWAGNHAARNRILEIRFPTLVKMARKYGLTKERHGPDDMQDEYLWLMKESRIRLITVMSLLDLAFTFFVNFPTHFSLSEMQFELTCDELIFSSPHPFLEQNFNPTRHMTAYEAYQTLYAPSKLLTPMTNGKSFSPLDMFLLIHLLYEQTHTHLVRIPPNAVTTPSVSGTSSPTASSTCHSTSSASTTRPLPDPSLAAIKAALARWRTLWNAVKANTPPQKWALMGFFQNASHFWLVTQLVINNKESAEVLRGMEVKCDDTLTQLRRLLKDTGCDN